ncbi:uncharacterized protein LOC128730408 [Anopheles nili]|uniref:uncharacterized protein LOC128730408 n=1 Tax=Anopheles nili TaxID=185578 RepID=UPI00237B5062|nr:uncharacterized protein LOC128730408 [Anopheles nili]
MEVNSVLSKSGSNLSVQDAIDVNALLTCLVLTYFAHFFGVCFIRAHEDYDLYHDAPVPTILLELGDDFEASLSVAIETGCQSFIVTERSVDAFLGTFLTAHEATMQRPMGKRLLMVLQPNSTLFSAVSEMLVIEEIPEVLIILPTLSDDGAFGGRIELYTVNISDGYPITIKPRLIDVIFTRQRPICCTCQGIDHFPDQFFNMNSRRLRLGTLPYLPNAFVEDVPLGEGNARYILPERPNVSAQLSGTELWLIVLFCEIVNCRIDVMMAQEWGNVLDNGTKTGLLGSPAKREVDISISGIYSWYTLFQHLAFTIAHSRSGCTCIVSKPRTVTNWRTPFISFTGSLWSAVIAAFLVGALAVLLMSRGRQQILELNHYARHSFGDSVLIMIGFFMEQSVRMPNELLASCILFATLMFAGFMIGSSYNGGLASTLIVPQFEKSIETVHDLAVTRTTWVGVTVSWVYSIELASQIDIVTLLETFQEWNETQIMHHAYDKDLAIIVERMEYGHFALPRIDIEAMKGRKMMSEDIYWESVVAMCTKTWPGRARFDRMVLDLKANGVLAHWELLGVAKFLNSQMQQIIRFSRDSTGEDEIAPLRMANVTGAILILITGLSISVIVFLVELLWEKFDSIVCIVRTFNEDVPFGESSLPHVLIVLETPVMEPSVVGEFEANLLQAVEASNCGGFVVTAVALFPFLDSFFPVHQKATMRPFPKHLVVVLTSLDSAVRNRLVAHEAFESLLNVLFIVLPLDEVADKGKTAIEFYTTQLHSTPINKPNEVELVQIGELTAEGESSHLNVKEASFNFFPDKIKDMNGRPIRVGTVQYPPYTRATKVPIGQGNARDMDDATHELVVDGMEFMLMLEFCRHHNCTFDLIVATDWGQPTDDGNLTGLLAGIVDKRSDVVLGATLLWHTWYQLASFSSTTGFSMITSLVPKPRLLPFWQTPFLTFPMSLWLMVGVTFAIGTVSIFTVGLCRGRIDRAARDATMLHNANDNKAHLLLLLDALFLIFGLYVEQSMPIRNDLLAQTVLFAALLFGGFMIGNSYAGSLASIMTLPRYERPIDTVADFVASGMRWTGRSIAWVYSLNEATNPLQIQMRDRFIPVFDNEERAQLAFTDRHMGYAFERMMHGSYCFGTPIGAEASMLLQPLKEDLYFEHTSVYYSKVWPLQDTYNEFILLGHQSGLLQYMEHWSLMEIMGLTVQRNIANARTHETDHAPVQLSTEHLLGAFFILAFGHSLAAFVLIAEIFVHWRNRQQSN